MKKFFTLIAMACMAIGVNAQTWNFSEWELQTINETITKDGLTVLANANSTVTIDGNNKTVDGVKYTQRLKTGGAGSAEGRTLSFNVTGKCTINVIACSSNSSDERTLNISAGEFANIYTTATVPTGNPVVVPIEYNGEATTIYLASASGGINFYAISVVPTTTGIADITTEAAADKNAPVYNLAGQRVGNDAKGVLIQNGKKFVK